MISYTQTLKAVIKTLRTFFSLESDLELADMIGALLKYQVRHKEFVEKLLEKKKLKDRNITRKSIVVGKNLLG